MYKSSRSGAIASFEARLEGSSDPSDVEKVSLIGSRAGLRLLAGEGLFGRDDTWSTDVGEDDLPRTSGGEDEVKCPQLS